ncbi:MAG: aminoacyl-tRNA hydrolase [bacterium]
MWIIVGLGNPGKKYRTTRHNIGFLVLEEFARRNRIGWRERKSIAQIGEGELAGQELLLMEPMVYMNRSGAAVRQFWNRWTGAESMVVVHDDMDLPFGRMRIKKGGGSGGHKGVRSVIDELATADFLRLKMGIGRPELEEAPEEYVLSRFSSVRREQLQEFVELGAEALECIVREGPVRAMNRFNIQRQHTESADRREEKDNERNEDEE